MVVTIGAPPPLADSDLEVSSGSSSPLISVDDNPLVIVAGRAMKPPRVIDCSARIDHQEEPLAHALVLSVFGDCVDGSVEEAIKATIVRRD